MKLTDIKGIGPKTEALFQKLGVSTQESLLRYYPIGYDSYEAPVTVSEAAPGGRFAVCGIVGKSIALRRGKKFTVVTANVSDHSGMMQLIWFNAPFMRSVLKPGSRMVFRGAVTAKGEKKYMEHPEAMTEDAYREKMNTLVPKYSLTKGLSNAAVSKAVKEILNAKALGKEILPDELLASCRLMCETEALRCIHFPKNKEELTSARNRLIFDEFLLFILAMKKLKERGSETVTPYCMQTSWTIEEVLSRLPYRLTGDQLAAWKDVERDLCGEKPMARLIQGDVGSGKTILAFLALIMTADNHMQGALMAPTEVLARQHYQKLLDLKESLGLTQIHPVLLTGSLRAKERREALSAIESGYANAVIGTHALIQKTVNYKKLGLIITDEQHRFGVHQRDALVDSTCPPHTMVMSATPIPRTLGIIYYGDLDISVIRQMPARRLPIKSALVDESYRKTAETFIRKQVEEGRQAYVICPLIEPSEEMEAKSAVEEAELFQKLFPDHTVGLLHGRMTPSEKDDVMERFLQGDIQILVSTTVVEVGVDVPNATVILIENAERFGLAALHQLRGRVGRGVHQSYCIFMAGQKSEAIMDRLQILSKSSGGFEIAEKDLLMRGPGDLLGIRQSGDMFFRIADITRDGEVLKLAGRAAGEIMREDPSLTSERYRLLGDEIRTAIENRDQNLTL